MKEQQDEREDRECEDRIIDRIYQWTWGSVGGDEERRQARAPARRSARSAGERPAASGARPRLRAVTAARLGSGPAEHKHSQYVLNGINTSKDKLWC